MNDLIQYKTLNNLFHEKKPKDIEDAVNMITEGIFNPNKDETTYLEYFFADDEDKLREFLDRNGCFYSSVYFDYSKNYDNKVCKILPKVTIERMKNEDKDEEYLNFQNSQLRTLMNRYKPKDMQEVTLINKVIYDQHGYFALQNEY